MFSLGNFILIINFTFIFSSYLFISLISPSYPALFEQKNCFLDSVWHWYKVEVTECKRQTKSSFKFRLPQSTLILENTIFSSIDNAKTWFPLKTVLPITGRNVLNIQMKTGLYTVHTEFLTIQADLRDIAAWFQATAIKRSIPMVVNPTNVGFPVYISYVYTVLWFNTCTEILCLFKCNTFLLKIYFGAKNANHYMTMRSCHKFSTWKKCHICKVR